MDSDDKDNYTGEDSEDEYSHLNLRPGDLAAIQRWLNDPGNNPPSPPTLQKQVTEGKKCDGQNGNWLCTMPKPGIFEPGLQCRQPKLQISEEAGGSLYEANSAVKYIPKQKLEVAVTDGSYPQAIVMADNEIVEIYQLFEMPDMIVPPKNLKNLLDAIDYRGVRGYHNSCYMDSMLLAMFGFTDIFDKAFFTCEPGLNLDEAIPNTIIASQARVVLSQHIVNKLRSNGHCGSESIMALRKVLSQVNPRFEYEFMGVEEVMNIFFRLWKLPYFLDFEDNNRVRRGDFLHRIHILGLPSMPFTTVQILLEQSMFNQQIQFFDTPFPALIIDLPRGHNGEFVNGIQGVIPNPILNLNYLALNGIRECIICGSNASCYCPECFTENGKGMVGTSYCRNCFTMKHSAAGNRMSHPSIPLRPFERKAERDFLMEIVAVICYKTNHFVSFVKTGTGVDASWIFQDSKPSGNENIINHHPNMERELTELENMNSETISINLDKYLCKRMLVDAHICIYRPLARDGN